MRDNHCPNAFFPSSFYSECLAVADSLCVPSDLIISFKSLYEKLRKVGLSAPPLHQPGNTFLLNSGDEANLKDFMESIVIRCLRVMLRVWLKILVFLMLLLLCHVSLVKIARSIARQLITTNII